MVDTPDYALPPTAEADELWLKIKYIELIDLINEIAEINAINSVINVENIESIDTIDLLSLITNIKNVESIDTIDTITSISNISSIDLIDLITKITEITTIKNIEVIESMPDTTPKGSRGVAFAQATPPAADWTSPTSHEDPDSEWDNETNGYDEDIYTAIGTTPPSEDWSSFVHFIISEIQCNAVKICIDFTVIQHTHVDVDIYKDGAWVDIYESGTWNGWKTITFSQGAVTKVRIRVYGKAAPDYDASICEVYFYEIPAEGGELVLQQSDATKLNATVITPAILEGYYISDKDDDASPNYYGFLDKNGNWYIIKETVSAGADTYRYAKGSTNYTTNWTNRASLSYDYFNTVF